jgi:hypothetical protein
MHRSAGAFVDLAPTTVRCSPLESCGSRSRIRRTHARLHLPGRRGPTFHRRYLADRRDWPDRPTERRRERSTTACLTALRLDPALKVHPAHEYKGAATRRSSRKSPTTRACRCGPSAFVEMMGSPVSPCRRT